ncbi:MAG: matrixin family metalloprotease [Planctomycetales bacterium]|nr:matrixin family metalloprotease [Planctomycetales bacterium]
MTKNYKLHRQLLAERLEDRSLLASDNGAFLGFGSITTSIAPDGTQIGFRTSELQSAFDARFGAGQWQPVIERAIQTWAREAELNVGFVQDNGAAAGIYGPSQGDSRFGDIRWFGVSLGNDVWAEAVSESARTAGTWAGDIIFNVDANWRDLHDLETVAMHELGHVLGLEHNADPLSPMNAHGPSASTTPTAQDIAILQAIHGTRNPDATEGDHGNDTLADAFRVKGNEEDGDDANDDFDGSQVWLQFGDLLDSTDVDVFEIHVEAAYTGPLAVDVRTRELSLANVQAMFVNRDGQVLSSGSINSTSGGQLLLSLEQTAPGEKYFVRISAGNDEFWSQGDYAVTIGTPDILANEANEIADWANIVHRWYFDSRGAKRGFSYHLQDAGMDGYSDDDGHRDDDRGHARELLPALNSDTRIVYSTVGTISDQVDIDYLRLDTPKELSAGSMLLVNLESLDANMLVPQISVLDVTGAVLDAELLSVGYGATHLLVGNIEAEARYLIRLDSSAVEAAHRMGNYSLNLELSSGLKSNDAFVTGQLSEQQDTLNKTLYIAIPQVITFSLESFSEIANTNVDTQATFQLFDSHRRLIHNIIAPLGTMRSLPGVLLDAGEYFLQVSAVSAAATLPSMDIKLSGTRPTDPIGPLIAPVDQEPMYTCEVGGDFCFPDGTESPIPSHVGPGPVIPLPLPLPAPLPPPPDNFFWENDLIIATNPGHANDTNGDGFVSPADVLLVVNYLNANGAGVYPTYFIGYVDTNADGFVSPIDALLIINQLNR